ncbi:hypothetical protein ACFQH6_19395 [Halobacteriaceae archaeon GCM10025711]
MAGGSGVSTDWLTTADGTGIRWSRVALLGVGGVLTAITAGFSNLAQGITQAWVMLIGGLAGFGVDLTWVTLGVPTQFFATAWEAPLAFLSAFGPAQGILALAIGLTAVYIVYQGCSAMANLDDTTGDTTGTASDPTSTVEGSSRTFFGDLLGVPSVLQNLGSDATSLLRDPRAYIIGVIVAWIVNGTVDLIGAITGLVLDAGELVAGTPVMLGGSLIQAMTPAAKGLLLPIEVIGDVLSGALAAAGPAAPIVAALGLVVMWWVAERIGKLVLSVVSPRIARLLAVFAFLDPRRWF